MGRAIICTEVVLDAYFATKREALGRSRNTDYWTASGIGYCLRRQYLGRLYAGVTNPPDGKALRAMAMGDDVHAHVKRAWQRAGMLVAEEVHLIDDELQLSGYLDAIVGGWPKPIEDEPADVVAGFSSHWLEFLTEYRRRLTERLRLAEAAGEWSPEANLAIEWKSTKEYSMQRMFARGPSAHHMLQVAAYFLIASRHPEQLPAPVATWVLEPISKSNFGILHFGLTRAWVDQVQDRIGLLGEAWTERVAPPCTCKGPEALFGGREWRYCKFFSPATGICCRADELDLRSGGPPDHGINAWEAFR